MVVDDDPRIIMAAWPLLSAEMRVVIAAIVRAELISKGPRLSSAGALGQKRWCARNGIYRTPFFPTAVRHENRRAWVFV
jgi:hypothetical protein